MISLIRQLMKMYVINFVTYVTWHDNKNAIINTINLKVPSYNLAKRLNSNNVTQQSESA